LINWDQQPMSSKKNAYMLWYYPSINRFADEDGNILHDLSDLFDVWELDKWKKTQNYDFILDHKGDWCELCYPSDFEEANFLEFIQMKFESQKMNEMYRQKAFC